MNNQLAYNKKDNHPIKYNKRKSKKHFLHHFTNKCLFKYLILTNIKKKPAYK